MLCSTAAQRLGHWDWDHGKELWPCALSLLPFLLHTFAAVRNIRSISHVSSLCSLDLSNCHKHNCGQPSRRLYCCLAQRCGIRPTVACARMFTHTIGRWNWLDCVVVLLGWLEYVSSSNYSAIRSVRVLRPLRTITKIEKMRVRVFLHRLHGCIVAILGLQPEELQGAGYHFMQFGLGALGCAGSRLGLICRAPLHVRYVRAVCPNLHDPRAVCRCTYLPLRVEGTYQRCSYVISCTVLYP